MLPSCTAGPGPWRARADLSRKTDVCWDTGTTGRARELRGADVCYLSISEIYVGDTRCRRRLQLRHLIPYSII